MINKRQAVREFLDKGATVKEAASLANANVAYVYGIRAEMQRERGLPVSNRGRPRKDPVNDVAPKDDAALKEIEDRFMETLKLKQEISDLTAVIVYLEHRLKAYGAAI
jgi:hypothetical protein